MQRDFNQYAWSERMVERRLQHFEILRIDQAVTVEQVRDAVRKELQGPGKLLGYRAMYQKIQQQCWKMSCSASSAAARKF